MLDELDLLKKDWKKQDAHLPKVSKADIYTMLLKKSSSIVKWIFIISIIEFAFWILLILSPVEQENFSITQSDLFELFNTTLMTVQFAILALFSILFYRNYKKIKITDNAKTLMYNIISTRKTVKYYIWINIIIFILAMGFATLFLINNEAFTANNSPALFIIKLVIVSAIVIGLFVLFYRLIYGILLGRLKNNYEELKKLEF